MWKEVGWSETRSEKKSGLDHLPGVEGGQEGRKRSQAEAIYQMWKEEQGSEKKAARSHLLGVEGSQNSEPSENPENSENPEAQY